MSSLNGTTYSTTFYADDELRQHSGGRRITLPFRVRSTLRAYHLFALRLYAITLPIIRAAEHTFRDLRSLLRESLLNRPQPWWLTVT